MSDQPLDLDALGALLDAATPGPWEAHDDYVRGNDGRNWVCDVTASQTPHDDAALIAALRNAAPGLIAAARALRNAPAGWDATAVLLANLGELEAERDAARAQLAALRERVEVLPSASSEAELRWMLGELVTGWSDALDTGCPSCGPVGFSTCDHAEGYHHALADLRAALATGGDRG